MDRTKTLRASPKMMVLEAIQIASMTTTAAVKREDLRSILREKSRSFKKVFTLASHVL
jgi:hypothetical protein